MELKIKTYVLQNLLSKAVKGASMNKMIPLTNLLSIRVKEGTLTVTTTDATNYLYVGVKDEDNDDFEVVVVAEIFVKLISKLTSEYVELSVADDILTVVGNGEYKIELPLNEEGNLITYPDPTESFKPVTELTVSRDDIQRILMTAKASLSTETSAICYTGYYIGSRVVTTDTEVMCGINKDLGFSAKPILVFPSTMDLLDIMTDAEIKVFLDDNNGIMFVTEYCNVCGKLMDCVDDFQIDVISELLEQDFPSSCTFSKTEFLQVLERVALFVGVYDKNCIYLTFTENGLLVQSKQTNSSETLKYASLSNFKTFTCVIDVEMLKTQIKAYSDDRIELQYGRENAVKLVDGDTVQIICLQEDIR